MNPSTINIIVMICLILLSMTFVDSIIVTIGGKKLFKKAQKNEKSALYPVANLFTLLEISEMSTFYGILFFVPVINCVVLFIMFYKLGGEFDTSTSYKLADEEYLLKLDSAKDESINLLSDAELKEKFKSEDEVPDEKVDSIFKSEVQMMEEVSPYKAKRNDFVEMVNEPKKDEKIEFVELENDKKTNKKDDKIEMIDL